MYELPRTLGGVILFSLDFITIYFVSIFISLEECDYLSISFFKKLASVTFEFVGMMVLVIYGKEFKNQTPLIFKTKVNKLLIGFFLFAISRSLISFITISYIMNAFFMSLSLAIWPTQYMFVALPFYVLYTLLKNILEIISDKAYSSLIQIAGFLTMAVALFFGILNKDWFYCRFLVIVRPCLVLSVITYIV